MGSWNGTCGLTGLPISYGDDVYAILIQKERAAHNPSAPCYPWELFTPATLMVRAKYNDYGGIELNDDIIQALQVTQETSSQVMDRFPIGDGDDFGYGFVAVEPFVIEEDEDEEFDLARQENEEFSLWMMHANIFDELCDTVKTESYVTRYKSVSVTKLAEAITAKNTAKDEAVLAELANIELTKTGTDALIARSVARMNNAWSDRSDGVGGAAIRFLATEISDLVQPNRDADMIAEYGIWVDAWTRLVKLYYMMEALRITLQPTGGAGSQDNDMRPYQARNAAMNRFIKAHNRKMNG